MSSVLRAWKPRSLSSMSAAGSPAIGVPARRCTSSILFSVDERSLRPMNLSTALQQQALAGGEFLAGVGAAAGVDDGGRVVGADVALDELPRRDLRRAASGARWCAGRRARSGRCGRRRPAGCSGRPARSACDANSGRSARSSGMLTSENAVTFCGLPSSNTWKSLGLEVGDELALLIEHARVDFDVVDFGAERDRRLLRRPARWPCPDAVRRARRDRERNATE